MVAALAPEPVTAASVLALVQSIESRPAGAPAAIAFRLALTRKGREAFAAGGPALVDELQIAVAEMRPPYRPSTTAALRAVWADVGAAP